MLWRGCFEPLPLHSPCHIHPRCNVTCPETSLWAALPSLAGITLLFSWSGDLPKLSPLRVGEEPAGAKIRNFCTAAAAAAEEAASRRKAGGMTPARALGHPQPDDWIVSLNIVIVCLLGVILCKLQNLTLCLKTIPHLATRLRSVERDAVLCFPYFSPNLFRPKWLKVVSHFWVPLFLCFLVHH